MPRRDRAYGATVPTKRSGGGNGRRTRSRGKNTYRAKQNRRPADGATEQQAATAETPEAAEAKAPQGRKQVVLRGEAGPALVVGLGAGTVLR